MPQFTMNIQSDLLLAAKRHALKSGTSLSEIVRSTLAREIGWSERPEAETLDNGKAGPALKAYSEGRMTRRQAMHELALRPEQCGEFVEAMNRLSLRWPEPDRVQIEEEARIVFEAIEDADDED